MAKRAATAKSKVSELTNKVAQLKVELETAQAEKKSKIATTKKEAAQQVETAKAEVSEALAKKDRVLHEVAKIYAEA